MTAKKTTPTKRQTARRKTAKAGTTRRRKTPTAKTPAKTAKTRRLGVVNVKVTPATRKRILANARRYARGNLSAWIRHTGIVHTPRRRERIVLTIGGPAIAIRGGSSTR